MPIYQRSTITSVDSLKAVAEHAGSHFFDAASMRFFNSRILEGVYPVDGWEAKEGARFIFVTSERYQDDPRQYSVRMMTLGSQRDDRAAVTIDSDFDAKHDTAARAKSAARKRAALIAGA